MITTHPDYGKLAARIIITSLYKDVAKEFSVVANNGKETPIETVSGGEFGRIQTSILLAIRNILSKIGGSKVNILFLDEITGVLDAAGKERLVDILMQEDANTFFISHDFEHPLIEKIQIVKQNNISKIGE